MKTNKEELMKKIKVLEILLIIEGILVSFNATLISKIFSIFLIFLIFSFLYVALISYRITRRTKNSINFILAPFIGASFSGIATFISLMLYMSNNSSFLNGALLNGVLCLHLVIFIGLTIIIYKILRL